MGSNKSIEPRSFSKLNPRDERVNILLSLQRKIIVLARGANAALLNPKERNSPSPKIFKTSTLQTVSNSERQTYSSVVLNGLRQKIIGFTEMSPPTLQGRIRAVVYVILQIFDLLGSIEHARHLVPAIYLRTSLQMNRRTPLCVHLYVPCY